MYESRIKSSVREVISEYGKLNDVDREGLEKILRYDEIGEIDVS